MQLEQLDAVGGSIKMKSLENLIDLVDSGFFHNMSDVGLQLFKETLAGTDVIYTDTPVRDMIIFGHFGVRVDDFVEVLLGGFFDVRTQFVLTEHEWRRTEGFRSEDFEAEIDLSVFGKEVPWEKLSDIMKNNQCREAI
jgi:hypothetical protein